MEKKKGIIIGIIIAVVAVIVIAVCVSSNKSDNSAGTSESQTTQQSGSDSEGAEEEATRPTFTYFISESDEGYDTILANIETLKTEYGDSVVFDIKNMEDAETQEIAANLPIEGNTPVVFMSTGAFEMKCSDIEQIRTLIDEALASK